MIRSRTKKSNVKINAKELFRRIGWKHMLLYIFWPLVFLGVLFMNFRTMFGLAEKNAEYAGVNKVMEFQESFHEYLTVADGAITSIAGNVGKMIEEGSDYKEVEEYLSRETTLLDDRIARDTTGLYGYVMGEYVDGAGWVPWDGYVATERPWYREAVAAKGRITYVSPYVDMQTGDRMLTIAKQVNDNGDVVAIDLVTDGLQHIAERMTGLNGDENVVILDEDGTVVVHSDPSQVGMNYLDAAAPEPGRTIGERLLKNGETMFEVEYGIINDVVFARVIGGGWYAVSVTETNSSFSVVYRLVSVTLVSAIFGTIFILAFMIYLTISRIRAEDRSQNLQSVSKIYVSIYRLNLVTDSFEEIFCSSDEIGNMLRKRRDDTKNVLRTVMSLVTDDRSRTDVIGFTDLTTLNDRMKNTDTLTLEFMSHRGHWCRGRFTAAERDENGDLKVVLWMVENIDEEKRSRDMLLYLSETDALTGICNRDCGESRIRKLLEEGEGGMFVLLDLDRFKSINDEFGHEVGDRVLKTVADCMKRAFRENDVIMRLGGDEFAAFMPLVHGREAGEYIIDRFLSYIDKAKVHGMHDRNIEVSIGVAFYLMTDTFAFETLYKQADGCAYESKKIKGSTVTFYEREDTDEGKQT
ncbi:MAG: diguanylate cyclase [Lachnospiraceae bacterium]|nr:diguanylate cyclase [Lachnospiraceae bacterium]